LSSVVVKSVDEARVRRAVDEYAQRLLSTRDDVEEIVVFGSFERGNYAPGSDVDLFIVLSRALQPVRERIPDLLPASFPVGIDLFPYTRKEMAALAPSPILAAVEASRWRYRR
jgi:predicted nucleotidyltransferase